jgi:Domain of unknown function (DUF5073)
MEGFDAERVSRTVSAALAGPGGVALVVNVFARIPGVAHTPARHGMFRSQPERVQIGDWRYEVTKHGRLLAAHVVNGIVLAEDTLAADAVGPHLARALSQAVAAWGTAIIPNIDAAVEALSTSAGL